MTSNDTLTALLSSSGELWEDSQVNPRQQKGMGDEEAKLSQPNSGWRRR